LNFLTFSQEQLNTLCCGCDRHSVYATPTSILATNDIKLQSVKPTIKAKGTELSNWMNTNHKMLKAFVLTDCLLYGV